MPREDAGLPVTRPLLATASDGSSKGRNVLLARLRFGGQIRLALPRAGIYQSKIAALQLSIPSVLGVPVHKHQVAPFRVNIREMFPAAGLREDAAGAAGCPVNPWAHCAMLALQSAGVESRLRVIHIGLGLSRDHVFLHFLTPHALVPRRVLL